MFADLALFMMRTAERVADIKYRKQCLQMNPSFMRPKPNQPGLSYLVLFSAGLKKILHVLADSNEQQVCSHVHLMKDGRNK